MLYMCRDRVFVIDDDKSMHMVHISLMSFIQHVSVIYLHWVFFVKAGRIKSICPNMRSTQTRYINDIG